MSKWKRKQKRALNQPALPVEVLAIKRDIILEHDESYVSNVRDLNRRVAAGKVPRWQWQNLRDSIAMHALRRAGVSLRESIHLMAL